VGDLALDIFRQLQPTLDQLLASSATQLYSGRWISDDSEIIIAVKEGSLWVTKLQLKGSDVLRLVQDTDKPEPITVWSTGRLHEFRMAFTLASRVCIRSWATIDDGFARGYPTDLIYFTDKVDGMKLHMPSVNLVFPRK
ncbi:hypothetical protein FB45DRAFT_931844, partial [Roridomyces roridus]